MKKTTYMIIGLLALTLIVETAFIVYCFKDPMTRDQWRASYGWADDVPQPAESACYTEEVDTVIVEGEGDTAIIDIKIKVTRGSTVTNDDLRERYKKGEITIITHSR